MVSIFFCFNFTTRIFSSGSPALVAPFDATVCQEPKVDIQNLTNHATRVARYYTDSTGEIKYLTKLSLLDVLIYTVHF